MTSILTSYIWWLLMFLAIVDTVVLWVSTGTGGKGLSFRIYLLFAFTFGLTIAYLILTGGK